MGPKFLCIGAMKSGTGWLYKNLSRHPEIWLPPVKELHYLDHIPERHPWRPILFRDQYSRSRARRYLEKQVRRLRKRKAPDHAGWALRYFLQPPSARWYGSLFPQGRRLAGECTPNYAVMSPEALKLLRDMCPDLKIIYLLRNPVRRDWSHAAMKLRIRGNRPMSIDGASDDVVFRVLKSVERTGKSDYLRTMRRWQRHFPPENMFIGFFDELERDPRALLLRIFEFLGVEPAEEYLTRKAETQVGKGSYSGIPDRFLAYLAARHYDRIAKMHQHFNNPYTEEWLNFAASRRDPQ